MAKLLKATYILQARTSDDLRYKLAKENNKKISTIDRWFRDNDVMLTTATNLEIIASHFNVSKRDALLEEVETVME